MYTYHPSYCVVCLNQYLSLTRSIGTQVSYHLGFGLCELCWALVAKYVLYKSEIISYLGLDDKMSLKSHLKWICFPRKKQECGTCMQINEMWGYFKYCPREVERQLLQQYLLQNISWRFTLFEMAAYNKHYDGTVG